MKKFINLLISPFLFLAVTAQSVHSSFYISGSIKGFSQGKAVLSFVRGKVNHEIAGYIKNEHFHFTGQLPEEQQISISFSNDSFKGSVIFFGGNEKITLSADTASLLHPHADGSASQKIFEDYLTKVDPIEKKSELLNEYGKQLFLSGKITEPVKDSLFKIHDDLDKEKRMLISAFAKSYPSSAVSAWAIAGFFVYDPQLDELEPAYNNLSKKNQQSLYGKQVKKIIETAKKTTIGRAAPVFRINDVNSKPVSLSSYKGKYVFIDFWASWCGPCRAENPNLVTVYKKYHSSEFDILGISLDADKNAWLNAISHDKLSWTQVSDLKAWGSKVVEDYGLKGIPFNMLLDKNGKIIAKNLRGAELEKKLKEILN